MEPAAPARNVVPLAALAIFLSRFVTPGIAPYAEPAVQAAFNLAIVLGVVVLGLVGSRWLTHLRASSPLLLLGVALYASAAALGGVVALARHNETNLVAGQFLSMGLLALAALGGWMNGGAAALKRFAAAISAMACVNCLAAMAFGAARLAHGQDPLRFSFPNGSAPTATALAAILLGLALGGVSKGWRRRLGYTVPVIVAAYALLSSVRSLWLAIALAAAAFVPLAWGARVAPRRWVVRAAGLCLAIAACGSTLAMLWWARSRPNLLDRPAADRAVASESARTLANGTRVGLSSVTTPEMPVGAYRIRGEVVFKAPGRVRVGVWAADSRPDADPLVAAVILGPEPGARHFSEVVLNTGTSRTLEVRFRDTRGVSDGLGALTLERLGPPWLGAMIFAIDHGIHRPADPNEVAGDGAFAGDASLAFRFKESKAALTGFLRSSWPERLLGHGLGARIELDAMGYDAHGRVVRFENPNYIHNFYLFLLFKLGIAGMVAVVTALVLWIWVPIAAALRLPPGDPVRVFLAATGAVWFGYAVWSLAAPEIVDFRVAPLWGFLLALTPTTGAAPPANSDRPDGPDASRVAPGGARSGTTTGGEP